MNAKDLEKQFLGEVRGLLNQGTATLDFRTKERLEQVRISALRAGGERRPGFFTPLRWIMVGSFATATMAAVALFFWLHPSPGVLPARHFDDFEIVTSREHIDLYQNLDFYRWLVKRENDPARGKVSDSVTM